MFSKIQSVLWWVRTLLSDDAVWFAIGMFFAFALLSGAITPIVFAWGSVAVAIGLIFALFKSNKF